MLEEQEHRAQLERLEVIKQKAEDRAYAAAVASEAKRWESEVSTELSDIVATESTPEDLAEEEYWDSLELLALLVEAEAGNQDLMGKRLVVDVVLNRVDSEDYPNTIEEVITQTNAFETWSNGAIDEAGYHMQDEDYEAVLLELEERLDYDILFFTAGDFNPYGTPAYQYGDHYFSY